MTKKKKIWIISSIYPSIDRPYRGIFVKEQAYCLAEKFDVRALVLARWIPELLSSPDKNAPYQVDRILGYLLPPYRGYILMPRIQILFLLYIGNLHYRKVIEKWGKPDIIHAHLAYPAGYLAVKLGQKYNIPVVITEHNSPSETYEKQECVRMASKHAYTHCNVVIGVSTAHAKEIIQFAPSAFVKVVGNVIDGKKFYPMRNKQSGKNLMTTFLTVSALQKGKGIEYLIQAASELIKENFYNFLIVIGGEGSTRRELEKLVKQNNLTTHCMFLGRLNHPAGVREAMQDCDVFVLPSLHETFGVVIAEAMACGKPVISTRCGGAEDIISEETGLLVSPGSVKELSKAMKTMIEVKHHYHSDVIRAHILKKFGVDAFIRNMSEVYLHL